MFSLTYSLLLSLPNTPSTQPTLATLHLPYPSTCHTSTSQSEHPTPVTLSEQPSTPPRPHSIPHPNPPPPHPHPPSPSIPPTSLPATPYLLTSQPFSLPRHIRILHRYAPPLTVSSRPLSQPSRSFTTQASPSSPLGRCLTQYLILHSPFPDTPSEAIRRKSERLE